MGVVSTPVGLQDMILFPSRACISSFAEVKSQERCPCRSVFARLVATSVRMIQVLSGELPGARQGPPCAPECVFGVEGAVVLTDLGNVGVVTDEQGNFGWVARDVADILNISDLQTIIERLDEDEHGKTVIIDSMGWGQETSIISESGFYAAIARSNKPEAKAFQRWVNSVEPLATASSSSRNWTKPVFPFSRHGVILANNVSPFRNFAPPVIGRVEVADILVTNP